MKSRWCQFTKASYLLYVFQLREGRLTWKIEGLQDPQKQRTKIESLLPSHRWDPLHVVLYKCLHLHPFHIGEVAKRSLIMWPKEFYFLVFSLLQLDNGMASQCEWSVEGGNWSKHWRWIIKTPTFFINIRWCVLANFCCVGCSLLVDWLLDITGIPWHTCTCIRYILCACT